LTWRRSQVQALVALGLLVYVEPMKSAGHEWLFPTLRPDTPGELAGAFGKWLGRYMRHLGTKTSRETLYSPRHNMKDFLVAVEVPSKILRPALGHTASRSVICDSR